MLKNKVFVFLEEDEYSPLKVDHLLPSKRRYSFAGILR